MTDSEFEWMLGMAAAYQPTQADEDDDPNPVPGIIDDVRDDSPTPAETHVRVVLETEHGTVDVSHDRVEVLG